MMDIPQIKQSNLLILRGVYLHDLNTLTEPTAPETTKEPLKVYTELPRRFTSVDTWLKFSNLKCWECDQYPSTYPKFIPMNPTIDADGNDTCDVYGNFCEWNCAVRFVTKEYPKEQQWDVLQTICLFESLFTGHKREKILASPSKICMKQYCGNSGITQKQYKEKIEMLNNDYDLSLYKLCHFRE